MYKPFLLKLAALLVCLVAAGALSPAYGQQRPLVTEDPEAIGAGLVLVEGGFDYSRGQVFPASGLTGNLLRAPLLGVSIGLSSIAELQFDGGLYNRLTITDRQAAPLSGMLTVEGTQTTSVEDLVIGTKVKLKAEGAGSPAIGMRFATKLPNASNEDGLGLDTTDFFASILLGKTVQSIRVVGNVGLGILGDPTRGDRQNDVLTYGVSFARAVAPGFDVVGEINGWGNPRKGDPPPGTENRAMMRLGARYTRGAGRVDGAILIGMTSRDPSFGITAGYTHVFNAFRIP